MTHQNQPATFTVPAGHKDILRIALVGAMIFGFSAGSASAIDKSVPRIHGDFARDHLGDGTDIIIGIVDSGVDVKHPALAGTDSKGRPRLVAQKNYVTAEPQNTGDDTFDHGTGVAGIALGRDPVYSGLATDARYVNARGIASNTLGGDVVATTGFAIANGAQVINWSVHASTDASGGGPLALAGDWIVDVLKIPIAGASGNTGSLVNDTGAGYNYLSVGASGTRTSKWDRVADYSSFGTTNGRVKPDVVAPAEVHMPSAFWDTAPNPTFTDVRTGTSFASPHVAGLLACQLDYGKTHGLSIDPMVLKATLMDSAEKIKNRSNGTWAQFKTVSNGVTKITRPLDSDSGAGQIDGQKLYYQYSAGEHEAGTVPAVGWDLNTIVGETSVDYALGSPLKIGTTLTGTLAWNRHVNRADNGNGILDGGDQFVVIHALDNLDLALLLNGNVIASSQSTVSNVEHIYWPITQEGSYLLRVTRLAVRDSGSDEQYALAWYGTAVPEPSAMWLLGVAMVGALTRRRRDVARVAWSLVR
jgi:hypothetical protein